MNPVVLIPAYQPDQRLVALCDGLMSAGLTDIIVINDGSREACLPVFQALDEKGVQVFPHAANLGKGRGLKNGFNLFLNHFSDRPGVITADADGQHCVKDIVAVAEAMGRYPDRLVLGARDFEEKDIPFRSRFGNKLTRRLFGFVCGLKLRDTQTGLRGIPTSALSWMMQLKGERFDYEMNMLAECARHGMDVVEVPMATIYLDENESSHFNPVLDSLRIYALLAKFAVASLGSAVLDLLIFTLLTKAILPSDFWQRLAVATAIARVCSSFFNYALNKNIVFKGNAKQGTLARYYALAIVQMACSMFLVSYLVPLLGWDEVAMKFVVDFVLFMISFKIQQAWVFAGAKKGGNVIAYRP